MHHTEGPHRNLNVNLMIIQNIVLSAVCGFFFAAAWWVFVDGVSLVDARGSGAGPFYLYLPGILSTIGLFLINNLPAFMFSKENTGDEATVLQKVILVISVICMLAGIAIGIWLNTSKKVDRGTSLKRWRAITAVIQAVVITIVAFLWCFLYKDPDSAPYGDLGTSIF